MNALAELRRTRPQDDWPDGLRELACEAARQASGQDRPPPTDAELAAHARTLAAYHPAVTETHRRMRVLQDRLADFPAPADFHFGTFLAVGVQATLQGNASGVQNVWHLDALPLHRPETLADPWCAVLGPLLVDWYTHGARTVRPNAHAKPLVPSNLWLPREAQAEGARLIRMRADQDGHTGQLYLPGLEQEAPALALPLQWWDMGSPKDAGGGGAALGLRLIVACLLRVGRQHWHESGVLILTYRHLLRDLWPATDLAGRKRRLPRPAQRRALFRAMNAVHSVEARFPDLIRQRLIQVVTIGDLPLPGAPDELDTDVRITVRLPAGSTHGPRIDRRLLARLGVESAPAYRLLLNLSALWHQPGTTRRRNEAGHWYQSRNPAHYPRLTDDDLALMACPLDSRRNRQVTRSEARDAVSLLLQHGGAELADGKLLPWLPNADDPNNH